MKKILSVLLVLSILVSCKEEKKQYTNAKTVTETKEERNINDFLVFENLLMEQNIEGAKYNNVVFDPQGAIFTKNKTSPTYITIPNIKLDLNKGFNVSFSFKTDDDDGTKPQSLIALTDKFSSASRAPFYVYFPGNRISGVFGKQLLWAEDYDAQNGNSKEYYDSFQLNKDQFYFVSLNFDGSSIQIFVNAELYASFENLHLIDFSPNQIQIGSLLQNEYIYNPFSGKIHGLKIFNKGLDISEILDLFNSQPEIDEEYN